MRIMSLWVSVLVLICCGRYLYLAAHGNKKETAAEDFRYVSLVQKVKADSLARGDLQARAGVLQRKVDSLTTLSKRFRAAPIKVLDSAAGIKSIRRDSLICTDEKTYRRLVLSSLNFGEEKYSLCLGQLAVKDSVIESYDANLQATLTLAEGLDTGRKEISLKLESVKRQRQHWFLSGVAVGLGVGFLSIYLAR